MWHRFGEEEKDSNECEGKWKKVCNMGKAGEEYNRDKNSAKNIQKPMLISLN